MEQLKRTNFTIYNWLVSYLRPYIKYVSILVICIFIITLIEASVPLLVRYLVDVIIPQRKIGYFWDLFYLLIGLIVVMIVLNLFRNILQRTIHENGSKDLLLSLIRHIQELGFSYYENTKVGENLSLLTVNLPSVQDIYRLYIPHMISKTIFLLVSLSIMVYFNWFLTLILVPCFILYYFVGPYYDKRATNFTQSMVQKRSEINENIYYSISSVPEIKANGSANWSMDTFVKKLSDFGHVYNKMVFFSFMKGMVRRATIHVGLILLIILGFILAHAGRLTVGEFAAFLFLYSNVMMEITVLITFATEQNIIMGQARPLYDLKHSMPLIKECDHPIILKQEFGNIVFRNVDFSYPSRDYEVLNQFNLQITQGQKIGIIGKSGYGKSTILKLLGRFYDPTHGEILVDGLPLKEIDTHYWRDQIGYIIQESYLFGGTIRENISFAKPDATDEEIMDAAKMAYAHEFIAALPDGYNTLVGERGVKLSGGQKQRISLARLFLKSPRIILLDEATSALDNESEQVVKKALERLFVGATVIAVAHRLSTLSAFDTIIHLGEEDERD